MELNGLLFSLNEETKEAVITGRTAEALNENGELLIPAKVVFDNVEYLVTEIGESAFDGDEDITALVVEEGVKTIRELAFNWCSSLKTVQLPASITTIENEVFHACAKLVSVVLPENLSTIQCCTFENCYRLQSVTWPHALESIENEAFRCCYFLQYELPEDQEIEVAYDAFVCFYLDDHWINKGDGKDLAHVDPEDEEWEIIDEHHLGFYYGDWEDVDELQEQFC